jgi:hypothetical protein
MDKLNSDINQLKDDLSKDLDLLVDSSHFGVEEGELKLDGVVSLSGTTYQTNEHLILELDIDTKAQIPCSVCNTLLPLLLRSDLSI